MKRGILLVLFCGFLSYSYGQVGNFDNMANDPSLLMEPNPSGGLLPPNPPPKPKKRKQGLLDMVDTPPRPVEVLNNEPPVDLIEQPIGLQEQPIGLQEQPIGFLDQPMEIPNQPMGPTNQEMAAIDQSMGPAIQDTMGQMEIPVEPVEQIGGFLDPPPAVQRGSNPQFSLAGSEVVKEWLPSNFADNIPSFDSNRMVEPAPGTQSKSVNQIFNSNLGSVQVGDAGMGNVPSMGMSIPRQPIVDSQFRVPDNMNMDPMDNAGVLDFQEFGNAIDLKSTADKGAEMLDMAMGIVDRDPNVIPGSQRNEKEYTFFHETQCRMRAHFTAAGKLDETTYEEYLNGKWEQRLCAPGSGYNVTTCGCTNMLPVGYNAGRTRDGVCTPDISLKFQGGVRDTSGNGAAVDYYGVDVADGTAYFDGNNRLYIWRYQSYDYRDKLQISFKFKPKPGPRAEPYTLVSNCEGEDEPSYGIVLNSFSNITTIFLKTYEIESQRFMTFDINPTQWNDVYFRYENGTMIGRVNNEIKSRPLTGIIQKRPDAMVFANCKRYGNFKGQLKDIVVYTKCLPRYERPVERYLSGAGL